jgi:hypothetical protein
MSGLQPTVRGFRPTASEQTARAEMDYEPPDTYRNRFRTKYSEFDDDGTTVALIEEREREGAWLLSTRTVAIER